MEVLNLCSKTIAIENGFSLMNIRSQILLDTILPGVPPGVNGLYATVAGRRVKSSAGKKYSKDVNILLSAERELLSGTFPADGHTTDNRLEFFMFCFLPPFVKNPKKPDELIKNATLSKSDSDGRLKAGKDSIITALGLDAAGKDLDDNRIYGDHCYKWEGRSDILNRYPNGYTRVLLVRFGYAPEILAGLRNELRFIDTEVIVQKSQVQQTKRRQPRAATVVQPASQIV
jgi:hypothetical protein